VLLYDADAIESAASVEGPQDLYEAQLSLFLDPNDLKIEAQAREGGVPAAWIEAAKRSRTYKLAVAWRIAFPVHPEYRTLPMVWYVPPLSPIQSHANAGAVDTLGSLPDMRCIPVRYLANLLTACAEAPIVSALERILAMRIYYRQHQLGEGDRRAGTGGASLSPRSMTCTVISRSPTTRVASSSRRVIASRRRMPMACAAPAASPSATAATWDRRIRPYSAERWGAASPLRSDRWIPEGGRIVIVFRAFSALLSYRTAELRRALPEIAEAVTSSPLIPARERAGTVTLIDELSGRDLMGAEKR
jgi:hypothetical protein